jgi:hypothetical protein
MMGAEPRRDWTLILGRARAGDEPAGGELITLVYDQLRQVAARLATLSHSNTVEVFDYGRTEDGRSPAMALGLSDHLGSVPEYVRYPVHADEPRRTIWAEERENMLTSALDHVKARRAAPSS